MSFDLERVDESTHHHIPYGKRKSLVYKILVSQELKGVTDNSHGTVHSLKQATRPFYPRALKLSIDALLHIFT